MASNIGLLLDTVNDNTGDKAIRIVMERFLKSSGIDYDLLNPFSTDTFSHYQTIIVGGGHLLRDKGDLFYDNFRVKGSHILNTVGITTTEEQDYLNNYLYLSVRSQHDLERMNNIVKEVNVVPCVTMLMEGKKTDITLDKNTIGFHFHNASAYACPDCHQYINRFDHYGKLFIPFTHYNHDAKTMRAIMSKVIDSKTVGYQDPEALFTIISKLSFLVCSSLHAAIFAYVNNVPFIVFPYAEKINAFMKDRGLEKWMFHNAGEMSYKLEALIDERPDYSRLIIKDKERVREHFYDLNSILKTVHAMPARKSFPGQMPARFLSKLQSFYRRSTFRVLTSCRHWRYNAAAVKVYLLTGTKIKPVIHLLFISKEIIKNDGVKHFLYLVGAAIKRKLLQYIR